ncbi:hypothetical protein JCM11641_003325 [Rhodosporidiobolus odoratus]
MLPSVTASSPPGPGYLSHGSISCPRIKLSLAGSFVFPVQLDIVQPLAPTTSDPTAVPALSPSFFFNGTGNLSIGLKAVSVQQQVAVRAIDAVGQVALAEWTSSTQGSAGNYGAVVAGLLVLLICLGVVGYYVHHAHRRREPQADIESDELDFQCAGSDDEHDAEEKAMYTTSALPVQSALSQPSLAHTRPSMSSTGSHRPVSSSPLASSPSYPAAAYVAGQAPENPSSKRASTKASGWYA